MNELEQRLSRMSPQKRAWVLRKLRESQATSGENTLPEIQIKPRSSNAPAPLSFAQQRLWFLCQLEGSSAHYNEFSGQRISGSLNIRVLERCLAEVTQRHNILRSYFPSDDGEPVQAVLASIIIRFPVIDLSRLSPSLQDSKVQSLARCQAFQSFDLSTGPLLRASVVRLDSSCHMLFITVHHTVSDRWSTSIFVKEIVALYNAYLQGLSSPLAPLELQYADYAAWQHSYLTGNTLQKHVLYWRDQLQDAPALLDLPLDRPRPAIQSYRGAYHREVLSATSNSALEHLSVEAGATPFMTLLSVFYLLLWRISGQQDIVVGSSIANRAHRELEPLIGFFVNSLALRNKISAEASFYSLLSQVRENCLQAYAHQDLPFEKLVEVLQPQRNRSHAPIFQVMFVYLNTPQSDVQLTDLCIEPFELNEVITNYDLTMWIEDQPDGKRISLEYNADLFDPLTMAHWLRYYQNLLGAITSDAEKSLLNYPLMSEEQTQEVLYKSCGVYVDFPRSQCLHGLFELQVKRTPDAVALVFDQRTLTYRQLNQYANQLAHCLLAQGVAAEDFVGVSLQRSVGLVVSLLAVLKTGAAYVPLDPTIPQARLENILQDSTIEIIICSNHQNLFSIMDQIQVLVIDESFQAYKSYIDENPCVQVLPEQLAYMMYTSGSSGVPKGVTLAHQGVVNRLWWMQQTFKLGVKDAVLQKTAFSFDVSVWEYFWPLMVGARLVLSEPGRQADNHYLQQLISHQNITMIHFVPSMLSSMLVDRALKGCDSLRYVVCSGEALLPEQVKQFFEQSNAELYNLYGPTEASIDVTAWRCQISDIVSIGRPINNTQIYLLDGMGLPVPTGVRGELCIGGVQLARGYWRRADLTAQQFVPNPYGKIPGERLYRSGDWARYLADGNIEYLGRMDQQIKLRGYRVELGEIASILMRHPNVDQAVVLLAREQAAASQLRAYWVGQAAVLKSAFESFIRTYLPTYMVPQVFVRMDEIPVTANGKIDRKALLEAHNDSVVLPSFVPPRNPLETALVKIWSDVLERDEIGVQNNFFDLGGHSLLANQIITRVKKQFGVELALRSLFDEGTIETMARGLASMPDIQIQLHTQAQLKAQIDQMSPAQVAALLEQKRANR